MIAGLTGGIASGKSLVSDALSAYGVRVIDADLIARDIVAPGQPTLTALVHAFGEDILDAEGRLDRALLRERAFADDVSRAQLNAITHPAIRSGMMARLAEPWRKNEAPYRVLSVPLLFENGLQTLADVCVVVDVSETLQLARASQRDGTNAQDIARIMRGQWSRARRLAAAHFVVDNHGERSDTLAYVHELHQQLMALAYQ